ncbi:2-hydroxy-6-oxo-2,4-heptadienoate hydrolase [Amycolatopsis balhimycina DSM 5908]|uniref:2-hydroxy-6-oxo-2,4-heptadienoate hydrolase n=1 Tax=Amycolatopsis balhimycina DSM 5908 TaxID=1081091 RepID=A0A428W063_AMYBA|nr:alpha/beta hydrolase [Amycolatopsis balhimycina]RSM36465.1 2-hydroxy-6-oxo-2,4-heptadienoate hydrolase [Amycolatopsis balhimycina DSM 5908]
MTGRATIGAGTSEIGRSISAGGIKTYYHDIGSGPPVLLLHGSGPGVTAHANWRAVIPLLAKNFRVIAPDLLGFGNTTAPEGARYDLDTWTTHLTDFADALGLAGMSLVGNSFGGALALKLATRHPERIDRLVLMGSVGIDFPITPGLERVWGFTPSLKNMRDLLDLFAHDRTRVTDDLAELRLAAATQPGVQDAFAAMFPAPRQARLQALAVAEQNIASLTCPTLILHGRDDQVIPLETSLRLHHLIRPSQLHVFGECGHWVQIERQDEFAALATSFLKANRTLISPLA